MSYVAGRRAESRATPKPAFGASREAPGCGSVEGSTAYGQAAPDSRVRRVVVDQHVKGKTAGERDRI